MDRPKPRIRQLIHESNLIEGYDSKYADDLSFYAWKWLARRKHLSHEVICEVQRRIVAHQLDLYKDWRGHYRSLDVMIGNDLALDPKSVRAAMTEWLNNYDVMEPIKAHIMFEHIHPFVDGNGRTGRLLLWWQQRRIGQELTMFKNSEKFEKYYPLFSAAKSWSIDRPET